MGDVGPELTRRLRSPRRWIGPPTATLLLILALASLGLALTPLALDPPARAVLPRPDTPLVWGLLAATFVLGELNVLHVEIGREAHTLTFSEVALVLGLLYATPLELLVLRTAGAAVVLLLVDRVSPIKLAFNLALFWVEGCLAVLLFAGLGGGRGLLDGRTWAASLISALVASATGALAVWAVVRVHGGETNAVRQFVAVTVVAAGNGCLAGVTATLLAVQRWALVPLGLVVATTVLGYRRYHRLALQHARLRALHAFTRATADAVTHGHVVARVLESAREVLGAGTAVLALRPLPGGPWTQVGQPVEAAFPEVLLERLAHRPQTLVLRAGSPDAEVHQALAELDLPDALVTPLLAGEEVVGALLLADRLRGEFDDDDARLLEALAVHCAVVLDRGRLVQEVHDHARAREHESLHDALTGLPNRVLLGRALERELAEARAKETGVAVLLLDLDQFKEVNDALGHHTGDELLRVIARRAVQLVGRRGTVARLGGDEFAVLLPHLTSVHDAVEVARQLQARVTEPVHLAQLSLVVGASIGVAVHPEHGTDSETLLRRADVAMYACKGAREPVAVYDAATDWNSPARLRIAADLRSALTTGDLSVYYQPIADVPGLSVTSVEALARWSHPVLGTLAPEEFVSIAERTGLIGPLTEHVLKESLRQSQRWRRAGFDLRVAVNLSVHVLVDGDWPARVLDLLRAHEVPPDRLTLEITESGIMADPERMTAMLAGLAGAGVSFSIDDFGTGHSSLAYLRRLPVREVKIDRSFVGAMTSDPGAASIVHSVVDLARNLGLRSVAEGVEDAETVAALVRMRCDRLQGFHLGTPVDGQKLLPSLAACGAGPS